MDFPGHFLSLFEIYTHWYIPRHVFKIQTLLQLAQENKALLQFFNTVGTFLIVHVMSKWLCAEADSPAESLWSNLARSPPLFPSLLLLGDFSRWLDAFWTFMDSLTFPLPDLINMWLNTQLLQGNYSKILKSVLQAAGFWCRPVPTQHSIIRPHNDCVMSFNCGLASMVAAVLCKSGASIVDCNSGDAYCLIPGDVNIRTQTLLNAWTLWLIPFSGSDRKKNTIGYSLQAIQSMHYDHLQ